MNRKSASRLAWILWGVGVTFAAVAVVFLILSRETPAPFGTFGFRGFSAVFALVFGTVGAVVASRRPENPVGWLFCVGGVLGGWQELADQYALYSLRTNPGVLPGGVYAAWFPAWIWVPATSFASAFLFLFFPSGRLLSPRWRWALRYSVAGVALSSIALAIVPGPLENFHPLENPLGLGALSALRGLAESFLGFYMVAIFINFVSLFLRFRRSRGEERQQMKWMVTAASFAGSTLILSFIVTAASGGRATSWRGIDALVIAGFLAIPVAAGVAVLRYRLYDIDVVINRAVVYGVLGLVIALVYAAVVVGPVAVLGSRGSSNFALSFVATAIAAVAFQPVRTRAQRLANRIVYGDRASPYETMSEFSHRMSAAISLEDVLPRLAEAAAKGIGAQGARALVFLPDGTTRSSVWPDGISIGGPDEVVTVRHADEVVGEIAVSKAANNPVTGDEKKLLASLASQAGLALSNVRQAAELRASRQRIVAAQDEERRRLERDIHDGAQQQLVSMAVKLRLAKQMLDRDVAKANEVLDSVITETNDAVESLRDLARGIFPPLLVDQGLVSALTAHISKLDIPASVEASKDFSSSRFDQSVEAAVYFCCLEAMQNASKHAPGSPIALAFSALDSSLEFSVTDRGEGFDVSRVIRGSGLQSMTDRIEALGGSLTIDSSPGAGTTVKGKIPIEVVVAA